MPLEDKLCSEFNIHSIVADLLVQRGIGDVESARKFLFPSTNDLCPLSAYEGLAEVVLRIKAAIDNRERVVIYGDYDCDGICATAMLYSFLSGAGAECSYYIPDRHTEGYGINFEALESIAEREFPDLIISVDCGITSVKEVEYAVEELGIDMIITDHHEPPEDLPKCPIFNPKLSKDSAYRDLCGAGVALRLIEALSDLNTSKKYYDIAALATVADVVPLMGDNRVIVYFGLKLLNIGRRVGIKMLAKTCVKGQITSYDIAFKLAPRINSTGRIETAAETVSLLYDNDVFMLETLIDKINTCNETRRRLTDDLTQACVEKLRGVDMESRKIIVLYDPYWDDGVLGITASRLVEMYNRPVLLMTDSGGAVKGSGRSVAQIDILRCINACASYLVKYGGHKMACGFTIDKSLVAEFDYIINAYCDKIYPDFVPYPDMDEKCIELTSSPDIALAKQIEMLQPFGEGNPRPKFFWERQRCNFAVIGTSGHIKEAFSDGEWVQFNAADKMDWYNSLCKKRFFARLDYRIFNNCERACVGITDVKPISKPPETLMLASYLRCSAGAEDKSIFHPKRISAQKASEIVGGRRSGVCVLAFTHGGADKAAEILSKTPYINAYGRPVTPCPYNTLIYAVERDADLSSYGMLILAEEPVLEGAVDKFIIDKDCKVYILEGESLSINGRDLPDYDTLAKIYKAIRAALNGGAPARSEFELYRRLDRLCGYSAYLAALFIFEDLGLIRYGENGYETISGVKRKLEDSALYAKLREVSNGR